MILAVGFFNGFSSKFESTERKVSANKVQIFEGSEVFAHFPRLNTCMHSSLTVVLEGDFFKSHLMPRQMPFFYQLRVVIVLEEGQRLIK